MKRFKYFVGCFLALLSTQLFAQGYLETELTLMGTANSGGEFNGGSVFTVTSDGEAELIKSYELTAFQPFRTSFVVAPGGAKLLGLTFSGGLQESGAVMEYDISSRVLVKRADLATSNSRRPSGNLLIASDDMAYGFSTNRDIFQYNPSDYSISRVSTLPGIPNGTPVELNGKIYGTTNNGGDNNLGTLFAYDLIGQSVEVLHHFDANASTPEAGVFITSGGIIYGSTLNGGADDQGTIFKYNPTSDNYTEVSQFTSATGGSHQFGTFAESPDDRLLFTLASAGPSNRGAIMALDTVTNLISTVHLFADGTGEPYGPQTSLTQVPGSPNTYYGATSFGGANSRGVVYFYNLTTDQLTTIHEFNAVDGRTPESDILWYNNALYGTATQGGDYNLGVFYKYDLSGDQFSVEHHFSDALDGKSPRANLIKASNGMVYGTTAGGGTGRFGTIFKIDPDTKVYEKVYDLNTTNGISAFGAMIEKDGKLYGTMATSGQFNDGGIFTFDIETESFETIYHVDEVETDYIRAGLTFNVDSTFVYGLGSQGGDHDKGSIFKLNLATQEFTVLHHFNADAEGTEPRASMVLADDGNFYGLAYRGGASSNGTMFKVDPSDDSFTHLLDFNETVAIPIEGMIQGPAGTLIGLTNGGDGALFTYNIASNTIAEHFVGNASVGRLPAGAPLYSEINNRVYFTFRSGGANNQGNVVAYNFDTGELETIYSFDGTIGSTPYATPLIIEESEPIVIFEDANFKAALVADNAININMDGEIQQTEAEAYTGGITATGLEITDLTGIQAFTELTSLIVSFNDLTELDVSQNTKLTTLFVVNNQISSLDVTANTALTQLSVINNGMTELTLGTHNDLVDLYAQTNGITNLDLTGLPNLEYLNVFSNPNLTSLDISQNTKLDELHAYSCGLTSLDVSNNPMLANLFVYSNNLTALDLNMLTNLDDIRVGSNPISTLDFSNSPNIRFVRISNMQLESIDISSNTNIAQLFVHLNSLTGTLDLSNHPNLTVVRLESNNLSGLNLTNGNNASIQSFSAVNNPNLNCIQVDDPAFSEANWTLVDDHAEFSTDCDRVNIPDETFEQYLLNNTAINTVDDGKISFGEAEAFTGRISIQNMGINDLTGIEAFVNLTELIAWLNNISSVDLSTNTELTTLEINNNPLGSIDVSQNTKLVNLLVSESGLTTLDISNNPLLEDLRFGENAITSIDVSHLSNLRLLYANSCQLTSIDVSQNSNLLSLVIWVNPITSVDLSGNPELTTFWGHASGLTSVDFSNNPKLGNVDIRSTAITTLDLSANPDIFRVYIANSDVTALDLSTHDQLIDVNVTGCQSLVSLNVGNGNNSAIDQSSTKKFRATNVPNLSCVTVDDVTYSESTWTEVDDHIIFSTDCSNDATDILTFSVDGMVGNATIDATNHTIEATVNSTVNLSSVEPTITISDGATISPSGAQDFTGTVTYTVTAEDNSTTQDWVVTLSPLPLGMNDQEIAVYPNPTSGSVSISGVEGSFSASVINIDGKTVRRSRNEKTLNFSDLESGLYLVKIESSGSNQTFRIMKTN